MSPYSNIYDLKKSLSLQTDKSLEGLDAVLFQEGHPVYFASTTLQPHRKAYVAIELESLAVTWAKQLVGNDSQ